MRVSDRRRHVFHSAFDTSSKHRMMVASSSRGREVTTTVVGSLSELDLNRTTYSILGDLLAPAPLYDLGVANGRNREGCHLARRPGT